MSEHPTSPPAAPAASRWRDGMLWLIVVIFALVVGVNAFMIWLAVGVKPDLVRGDYYEASKQVDAENARRGAAQRLGWQVQVQSDPAGAGAIAVMVTDRDGQPVTGVVGIVRGYRPNDASLDQGMPLQEDPAQAGRYHGTFTRPVAGLWRLTLDLRRGEERMFQELPLVLP